MRYLRLRKAKPQDDSFGVKWDHHVERHPSG